MKLHLLTSVLAIALAAAPCAFSVEVSTFHPSHQMCQLFERDCLSLDRIPIFYYQHCCVQTHVAVEKDAINRYVTPQEKADINRYVTPQEKADINRYVTCISDCEKKNERENRDVNCYAKCDPKRLFSKSPTKRPTPTPTKKFKISPSITWVDDDSLFDHDSSASSSRSSSGSSSSSYDDGPSNDRNSNRSSSSGVSNFSGSGRLECPGFSTLDESACKRRKRCEFSSCDSRYSSESGWSGSIGPNSSSGRCGYLSVEVVNEGMLLCSIYLFIFPPMAHVSIVCDSYTF